MQVQLSVAGDEIRHAGRRGRPLEEPVRTRMEASLGADLGAVRIHTDSEADALARALGADAFASGSHVFFRSGAYRPDTAGGLFLLGHEAAHVLQQAAGRLPNDRPDRRGEPPLAACLGAGGTGGTGSGGTGTGAYGTLEADAEAEADAVARRVVAGLPATVSGGASSADAAGALCGSVVQRHASWEHRLLGDAKTVELNSIALRQSGWQELLGRERDFLWMWHQNPERVTEAQIKERCPWIRTLRLNKSGLLVTYGELNTLPDYMANPGIIDDQPKEVLLPILQRVRQEGYNRVRGMLGDNKPVDFQGSVSGSWSWTMLDLLLETRAMDKLTWNIGPDHTNHYGALLGRNACHFAPFAWWRWQAFHTIARDQATRAHQSQDAAERQRLTYQAWMYNGYADHFLQDSFAAGHLVNKTLIMQWFVEWAGAQFWLPLADWDVIQYMTTARQPGIAAWALYGANPGGVRDPQTTEEQPTFEARRAMSGAQADGNISLDQAYKNYWTMMNSSVVNAASGLLHDHYNADSLWVSSADHPAEYQLWGDDTMLNGGGGVAIASETAHMSQQAMVDILAGGSTSISVEQLRGRFPTSARSQKTGHQVPLEQWHRDVKDFCFSDVFGAISSMPRFVLLRGMPHLQYISVDRDRSRDVDPADVACAITQALLRI